MFHFSVSPADRRVHYCLHQLREIQPAEIRGDFSPSWKGLFKKALTTEVEFKSDYHKNSYNFIASSQQFNIIILIHYQDQCQDNNRHNRPPVEVAGRVGAEVMDGITAARMEPQGWVLFRIWWRLRGGGLTNRFYDLCFASPPELIQLLSLPKVFSHQRFSPNLILCRPTIVPALESRCQLYHPRDQGEYWC